MTSKFDKPCTSCGREFHWKKPACPFCGAGRAERPAPARAGKAAEPVAAAKGTPLLPLIPQTIAEVIDDGDAPAEQPPVAPASPAPVGDPPSEKAPIEDLEIDDDEQATIVQLAPPAVVQPKYVATKKFTCQIGSNLATIEEGHVFDQKPTIDILLAQKQPIVPVELAEGYITCPHCQVPFKPQQRATRPRAA